MSWCPIFWPHKWILLTIFLLLVAGVCGCCGALRPRYKRLVDNIFPEDPEVGVIFCWHLPFPVSVLTSSRHGRQDAGPAQKWVEGAKPHLDLLGQLCYRLWRSPQVCFWPLQWLLSAFFWDEPSLSCCPSSWWPLLAVSHLLESGSVGLVPSVLCTHLWHLWAPSGTSCLFPSCHHTARLHPQAGLSET